MALRLMTLRIPHKGRVWNWLARNDKVVFGIDLRSNAEGKRGKFEFIWPILEWDTVFEAG